MSTLVLKSRSVITNPKYGKLIDLDDGARIVLDARTLDLANGAIVDNWQASGSGSTNERVFSASIGTWEYPVFDNSAIKSVKFNGNQMIANQTAVDNTVTTATYVVVAKFDTLADSAESRLMSSAIDVGTSTNYQAILPRFNGVLMQGIGDHATGVSEVGLDWFVGIFVFDGADSKYITTSETSVQYNARNEGGADKIALGGNINKLASNNSGFKGNIAIFAQYERALSDKEMVDIMRYYKTQFAI